MAALVVMQAQAELLEVVDALGPTGGLAGGLDGGEEQADEDGDDGDDDQQLDEREAATRFRFHGSTSYSSGTGQ